MASTSETGHAKNIANFFTLNQINAGFGATYNPSNPLQVNATMVLQHTSCNNLQLAVNTQNGIFKPIVNARVIEFKSLESIVRKIRNYAKSCGASDEWIADVSTLVKKILGERVSAATPTPADPAGTSASQQSYDKKVDHFDQLIELLKNEPLYIPNENEIKIITLEAKFSAMDTTNNAVKTGRTPYNNAIIARNKALYTTKTGMIDVGQASKDYVRSTFGFTSPEFKLVSPIRFKKIVDVD